MESFEQKYIFLRQYLGYGEHDMQMAYQCLHGASVSPGEFGNYVRDHCVDTGISLQDVDICEMALQCIAELAGVPELNGYLYGNFADSRFDIKPEVAETIMDKVPEYNRGHEYFWLCEFLCITPTEVK